MSVLQPMAGSQIHSHNRKRRTKSSWVVLALVIAVILLWFLPLYAVLNYSLKNPFTEFAGSIFTPAKSIHIVRYVQAWKEANLTPLFWNSVFISTVATAISLFFAFFIAFGIGIGRSKHRVKIMAACMVAFAIPQEAVMFPGYKISRYLNLYGTQIAVAIILGILYATFATFLLTQVISDLPKETIEAAQIDGASSFQLLRKIIFPIIKPTLLTLAAMIFIWCWNEYMIPLIMLPDNETQTLPMAIGMALGGNPDTGSPGPNPYMMSMAAVLGSLPSLAFFLIFQNTLTRGVTAGSTN